MKPERLVTIAAVLLALGTGAAAGTPAAPPSAAEEDAEPREAYIAHPEFRSYRDQDRLAVEGVTLIRVRRSEHSEALVAREETGWEHVVLEGYRLIFYNQARQPLRPVPGRHVVVADWSGGVHCCFDYYILHVAGTQVRREAMIRAGDCGLRVADIDQDGSFELIACDSRFAYGFDLSFAESPLVPLVYTFRDKGYAADNRRYPQVFRYRMARERQRLAAAEQARDARTARIAAISLVLHMLYAGRVTEAWCTFGRAYRWADRAAVRQEILEELRRPPDPDDPRLPIVDLAYALAPPGRCP